MRAFDVVFGIFQNQIVVMVALKTGAGDGLSKPVAKLDARGRGEPDEVEVVEPVAHGEDLATVDLEALGHSFHRLSKTRIILLEENLHLVFARLKFAWTSNLKIQKIIKHNNYN